VHLSARNSTSASRFCLILSRMARVAAFTRWTLFCRFAFISSKPQAWQKLHPVPKEQPLSFQTQAHGLHPLPWFEDPFE